VSLTLWPPAFRQVFFHNISSSHFFASWCSVWSQWIRCIWCHVSCSSCRKLFKCCCILRVRSVQCVFTQ
jgi:hypothetical protein